ncbi:MAG: ATP-grasp domain-containing protein [Proteobacteria bacterium]|nr:ATP-grasp domain-containing protein [Pseudomonadota bacterium]
MGDKTVNILFISAGRRVELIRLFKKAYIDLKLDGKIVATDIDPLAPSLREIDGFYIVPRTSEDGFIPAIAEICQREKINLVFPLIDPDIPVLAHNRSVIENSETKLVVIPEEFVNITADKWQTYEFLKKIDIPTPYSWLPEDNDSSDFIFPVFIKPRFGSAAKFTFKVNNERKLRFFCEYVPDPIIQEYLPGPEVTSDVICDFEGNALAVVSRQRIEVRWGEVVKGKTIYHDGITSYCIKIAKALKAIGPITVQCFLKDNEPVFSEINPRYGGGVPLGIAAGVPSPCWFLSLAAGRKVESPPLGSYKTGLHITRFDDSFFLSEEDLSDVASRSI